MAEKVLGELVPVGGGNAIPLTRETMTVGRRRTNDICLDFANVSGQHCEFSFKGGAWVVRDLHSQNGTKVNGERVVQRTLKPGDLIGISKQEFKIQYEVTNDAMIVADILQQEVEAEDNTFSKSLLEKAGLARSKDQTR
jgi:pSer/pThr/pTyr-binding forkhead associated (FHA) protein